MANQEGISLKPANKSSYDRSRFPQRDGTHLTIQVKNN